MKICENCGKNVENNAEKCENCGFVFKNEVENINETTEINQNKPQSNNSSILSNIAKNLSVWLGFIPVAVGLFLLVVLCCLAIVYFNHRRFGFETNINLRQACIMMIILFSIFLIIFTILFILSLYFNIKKHLNNRKKTN